MMDIVHVQLFIILDVSEEGEYMVIHVDSGCLPLSQQANSNVDTTGAVTEWSGQPFQQI